MKGRNDPKEEVAENDETYRDEDSRIDHGRANGLDHALHVPRVGAQEREHPGEVARDFSRPNQGEHQGGKTALLALQRARERDVWLPVRPVTRRCWPNGAVTHDELKPLKMLASRMACPYLNPGRYQRGGPLVQGMRVALSAEVNRTHEELVERILHAGLAYADAVDPETSLVICNETAPDHGKGFQARELGVPTVSDEQFMRRVAAVTGGIGVETFEPSVDQGQQFALF